MATKLRLGSLGLSATLFLVACAPVAPVTPSVPDTTPATVGPLAPADAAIPPEFAGEPIPEFPQDVQPLALAPSAPQPPLTVGPQGLMLPNGGAVNLDNLDQELPPSIPQDQAPDYLSPMPGNIPQGFGQMPPQGTEGVFPGTFPDLFSYNALARCLYYRYQNFWVPYILVNGAYYPYGYSPYYNVGWRGYCAYPLFYSYGGYYYPYTFLTRAYRFGYLDWEYYWPTYRSRYRHRYNEDYGHYRRYWSMDHFQRWLDRRKHGGYGKPGYGHGRPGHGGGGGGYSSGKPGYGGGGPGPNWNQRPNRGDDDTTWRSGGSRGPKVKPGPQNQVRGDDTDRPRQHASRKQQKQVKQQVKQVTRSETKVKRASSDERRGTRRVRGEDDTD